MGIQVQPVCCKGDYLIVSEGSTVTIYKINLSTGVCSDGLIVNRGTRNAFPSGVRKWTDDVFYCTGLKNGLNTQPDFYTFDPVAGTFTFIDEISPHPMSPSPALSMGGMAIDPDGVVYTGSRLFAQTGPTRSDSFLWSIDHVTGIGTQYGAAFDQIIWGGSTARVSREITDLDFGGDGILYATVLHRAFKHLVALDDADEDSILEWWSFDPADGSGTNLRVLTEFPVVDPDDGGGPRPAMVFRTSDQFFYLIMPDGGDGTTSPYKIYKSADPENDNFVFVADVTGIAGDYFAACLFLK